MRTYHASVEVDEQLDWPNICNVGYLKHNLSTWVITVAHLCHGTDTNPRHIMVPQG